MNNETMACLELEFAVPLAVATGGLEDLVSESCRKAHRGTRPRGAADGEGTEADGRAERGTDGMRPRGADTAQPS